MSTPKSDIPETYMDQGTKQRFKELLRDAVDEPDDEEQIPDVLEGIQQKLRVRSGGKFYDDAWSTARHAPVSLYLVTSLMMLFVLGVAYFVLQPLSGRPEPVRNQPDPVEVIAPVPLPRPVST